MGSFWFFSKIGAFSGPPGPPGEFTGSPITTNGTNFAIGTTVQSDSLLTIYGGNITGLRILDNNAASLLEVGPSDVKIGNPTGATLNDEGSLRVSSIRASSTRLGSLYAQNAEIYGDLVGLPGSSIYGFLSIEADSISSTFKADNVSAGIFPAGNNFAFGEPAYVGINMPSNSGLLATLHVNGTGYFSGNVGIGVTPSVTGPGALNVTADSTPWLLGFDKGIRLEGNSAIEFGGGTAGTLYGIGASSSRLYVFNTNTELNSGVGPNFYNLTLSGSGVGVGIGATDPLSTLHVSGTLRISGASGFRYETSTAVAGRVLTLNANGDATWADAGAISGGSSGDTARYNGGWIASSLLYNNGSFVGVSTTAASADGLTLLRVGSGGYFQFDRTFAGTPTPGECTAQTTGRITLDTTNNFLYVCVNGAWKALKLIN